MDKLFIRSLLQTDNPIVVEIGSADGLDTLEFIEAFDDLNFRLFAIEPDKRNIDVFKSKIKDERVSLFEGVIGDKTGKTNFNMSTKSNITEEELIYSGSLREPGKDIFAIWPRLFQSKENFQKIEIDSITLDKFVEKNNIKKIDFIWMDVQGCEDLVINGGKNTFENKVDYIYTEYSDFEIYDGEPNLKEILSLLPNYEIIETYPNPTGGDILLKRIA